MHSKVKIVIYEILNILELKASWQHIMDMRDIITQIGDMHVAVFIISRVFHF